MATLQARITALAQAVGADIKSVWAALDGKSDAAHTHSAATPAAAGFMSGTDKTKLDGIATGANAYTHPESHPPSIIAQDASNRFVTDAEKSAWNGKADGTHSHSFATITGKPTTLAGYGITDVQASIAANIHSATAKATPGDADEIGLVDSAASWALKKLTFANLKAWIAGLFVSRTSAQIDGNLNITGTARRITGDFSNTTLANRAMFQTSAANSPTTLGVLPSGTSDTSALAAYSSSEPSNTSSMRMLATSIDGRLDSGRAGGGSFLPMTFFTGNAERMRIDTNGNVGVGTSTPASKVDVRDGTVTLSTNGTRTAAYGIKRVDVASVNGLAQIVMYGSGTNGYLGNIGFYTSDSDFYDAALTEKLRITADGSVLATSGALGYGVGAGGAATQTGSRSTGVALNKPSGAITLVSAAGTSTWQSFTLTNSFIAENDSPIVVQKSGTDLYEIHVSNVVNGSCRISFRTTGGTTIEQPVFNFAVLKGSAA